VRLAVVVQRYGTAINGGAEQHARYIAERLSRHVEVDVLTTCAADYVTWRNDLAEGSEQVNGLTVRRFPVRHERDPGVFGRWSERVFLQRHSVADELAWLEAEGPACPALTRHVARHARDYTYLLFFSYRYYHSYYGARAAASRAVLVPTAERDAAVGVSIFHPIFRGVRALMYNSPEEQTLIQSVSGNRHVPSVVVGVGSEVPASPQAARFRQKFDIQEPFAVYVGRIDENKGCKELFDDFQAYSRSGGRLALVLIGHSLLPLPEHPRIRHLGFVSDTDKFDAMAAAELLIMPSYFESLSMVALEAWALGKPVLVNGRCDVLKGQCIRSQAGLYYETVEEFVETLRALERSRWLSGTLGRNGRQFFRDHYAWPVIERKYLDLFERLSSAPTQQDMEPLPNWLSRRRRDRPAAQEVVDGLATGPSAVDHPTPARAPAPIDERAAQRQAPAVDRPRDANRPPHRARVRQRRGRPPRAGRA
jgi:glycosyltransferase involved in cell wall biosynthesis